LDQPFAGLVKELFERQRYADELELGTSKAIDLPYDATGWTLPLQMKVPAAVEVEHVVTSKVTVD